MKKYLFLLLVILPLFVQAQVTIRDTIITWHTFDYTLTENNTINWATDVEYDTVPRTFSGYILENEYLKVTLLPEFGGRILSMIYKPTGKEQLYQNPSGTPYGIGQDWFYYSWLMVYGGIFPTLTEPEHGKAWLLPWEFTVLTETPDTIRCVMSWTDTVNRDGIDPGKWKYGKTNLRCDFTITLVKGSSSLEADITLYNDSSQGVEYEYWTCLTLAPGSDPADPKTTEGAELIIPASKVKIPAWYPDIQRQETRIPGQSGVYTFTKLRSWKNWTNDGIAYPWDDNDENYWGVIDRNNKEGFIRVAENNVTTGIKIWAWGYPQSSNIDPFKDPAVSRRPYIELWAGHSNEFFEPAFIQANSVKEWKEIYVPTVGITDVTDAANNIIADLKIENQQTINLGFVTTKPGNDFDIIIEITGSNPSVLFTQTVSYDPVNGNSITAELPHNQNWSDDDSLVYTIASTDNNVYIKASRSLKGILTNVDDKNISPEEYLLSQNYPNPFNPVTNIEFQIPSYSSGENVSLKVYDILGSEIATLVNEVKLAGVYNVQFDASALASGTYYYKLIAGDFVSVKKMLVLK